MNSLFPGFLALHSSISLCYCILTLCSSNCAFLFTSSSPINCHWTLHVSTSLPLKLSSLLWFFLRNCDLPTNLSVNVSLAEILAKCLRRTKIVPSQYHYFVLLCHLLMYFACWCFCFHWLFPWLFHWLFLHFFPFVDFKVWKETYLNKPLS